MTEWEKAQAGYLYNANDPEILKKRMQCADLCHKLNQCRPSDTDKQNKLVRQIIGNIQGSFTITLPFFCDYGINISVGENFYANHNCSKTKK